MRNSKIKALFEKAEEQIQVDEIRKQETYNMMLETMEKQRTPMMSTKNIHRKKDIVWRMLILKKSAAYLIRSAVRNISQTFITQIRK